jgi:hypothetical protein
MSARMALRIWPVAAALWAADALAEDKPAEFLNLTSSTVVTLRLSHAGSGEYGDNLAASGVGHDERLKINDVPTGHYDAELKYKNGRICFVRYIEIVVGKEFSIDDKALTACSKK